MGEVLAMIRGLTLLLCAAALSACSITSSNAPDSAADLGIDALTNIILPDDPPPDAREVLTPEAIARSPTSALLVVVEQSDRGLSVVPIAANRGTVQWLDGSGGGLFTRDGVLVGTRGLGFDLMTADVAALRAALPRGGGSDLLRVNRHLDGTNQMIAERYLCDLVSEGGETLSFYGRSFATTRLSERCMPVDGGPAFTNNFWVERDGTIRRSRVFVSPEIGSLRIDLIAD